jgi:hypothetical protein
VCTVDLYDEDLSPAISDSLRLISSPYQMPFTVQRSSSQCTLQITPTVTGYFEFSLPINSIPAPTFNFTVIPGLLGIDNTRIHVERTLYTNSETAIIYVTLYDKFDNNLPTGSFL